MADQLNEVVELVALEEDPERILGRLAETACLVLAGCLATSVTVVERGRPRTIASTGALALALDDAQYEAGYGPCLRALRDGKVVSADFRRAGWPSVAAAALREGVATALSVPLVVGGVTLGSLNVYTAPAGPGAQADEVAASLLAEQAAAALATAQALAVERQTVLTLQGSLLPAALPTIAGYDLCARYFPAGATADVGGDWYDAFSVAPPDGAGPVAVVIGDAAGHGLPAAALMGQLRTGLRAYAVEGHDPGNCLNLLSRLVEVAESDTDPLFATACIVLVDPPTGMCRLARAGHLPPAIRKADGTVEFVGSFGGPPLGIVGGRCIDEDFFSLNPGSALVLFTDGLVEDRRRSVEQGLAELAEALAERFVSSSELCDQIVDRLLGDRLQEDDVAVLVLQRSFDNPFSEPECRPERAFQRTDRGQ